MRVQELSRKVLLAMFLTVGLVVGRGLQAAAQCVSPDVWVPIEHVEEVKTACMDAIAHKDRASFEQINAFFGFAACPAVSKKSKQIRSRLDCVGASMEVGSSLSNIALRPLETSDSQASNHSTCSQAYERLKRAREKGDGLASDYLFYVSLQGSFRGVCGPSDEKLAAEFLLDASQSSDPDLRLQLVTTQLVEAYPEVFSWIDKVFDQRYSRLGDLLGPKLPKKSTREMSDQLTVVAMQRNRLASHLLIQLYDSDQLGVRDRAKALAWSALDEAVDEPDSPSARKSVQHWPSFQTLFESSSESERSDACRNIADITTSGINFRFSPGEIKNEFVVRCVDARAVVAHAKCLGSADLADVDRIVDSLVAELPQCR